MLKISPCLEMFFKELPFERRIEKAAEIGFTAFEFWGWRKKNIEEMIKIKTERKIKLVTFTIDSTAKLINSLEHDKFIKDLEESLQIAKKLNCDRIIVTVGDEEKNLSRNRQHENIVKGLKKALGLLDKWGVTLMLEPLNTLVDHAGHFLSSSKEAFQIVDEVNSERVKVLYDIYHLQIMEGNLISTIEKNINRIGHFHIADVPDHNEPGSGEINYGNVLKRIEKLEYDGFVGLEYSPMKECEESLRQCMDLIKETV